MTLRLLRGGLALLRTRIPMAVLAPALLGGAWCVSAGSFRLSPFLLVLAGLLLAEFMSLLASDFLAHVAGTRVRSSPPPQLPGSPVLPERLLPSRRLPLALAVLAAGAAAVLAALLAQTGSGILLLLVPAVAAGALYALQPAPIASLATAIVPPLVTAGTALAVSGRWDWYAAAIGIPGALSAAGVICTYRFAGWERQQPRTYAAVVLALHGAALAALPALVAAGVLPPASLLAAVPAAALLLPLARLLLRDARDPVAATAVGVFLHAALHVAVAVTLVV